MTKTSIFDIKKELLIFLRNSDIISTTNRGVTTSTDTGTFATAGTHTLATNPTLVKNVRSVTVAGSLLTNFNEYTVDYTTGVITFITDQTGTYSIVYDQAATDHVWPDYPQPYLKLKDFPRVGFDIVSGSSNEFGIGANTTQSEYLLSITCYDKDESDVEEMIATVRSKLLDNKKNFHFIPFLSVTTMGPLLITPFGQNKIMQRNQDLMIKFIFEQ